MSPDNPKLSLESKRTFLEQALSHALAKESNDAESDDVENEPENRDQNLSLFKFVKVICINKSFMMSSRFAQFNMYNFNVQYPKDSNDEQIHFLLKHDGFNSDESRILLPYDRAYNLAKLLKPPCINFVIDDDVTTNPIEYKKISKLLEITNGKVGMLFKDQTSNYRHYRLIKKFSSRIYKLECHPTFLDDEEKLALPALQSLVVGECESFDQIKRVLQYRAKTVSLNLCSEFFADQSLFEQLNSDSNDESINVASEEIKRLELKFNHNLSDEQFKQFIFKVVKLCPTLNELSITKNIELYSEISVDDIPDKILSYNQLMHDLTSQLPNFKISIHFGAVLYVASEDCHERWFESTIKSKGFKDWSNFYDTFNEDDTISHSLNLFKTNSDTSNNFTINFVVKHEYYEVHNSDDEAEELVGVDLRPQFFNFLSSDESDEDEIDVIVDEQGDAVNDSDMEVD